MALFRGTEQRFVKLTAQPKALNELLIALIVCALQIVEQAAALANHDEQAATGMEVLFMGLQMVRQVLDALAQYRDLHLRRTGVTLFAGIFLDERLFALGRNRHRGYSF